MILNIDWARQNCRRIPKSSYRQARTDCPVGSNDWANAETR